MGVLLMNSLLDMAASVMRAHGMACASPTTVAAVAGLPPGAPCAGGAVAEQRTGGTWRCFSDPLTSLRARSTFEPTIRVRRWPVRVISEPSNVAHGRQLAHEQQSVSAANSKEEWLTTNEAMIFPKPTYPEGCPGCAGALTDDELAAVRAPAWAGASDVTCEKVRVDGEHPSRTQLANRSRCFKANSVSDLTGWIDEVQQGDDITFIDFDEDSQDYVFGYDGRGVELPFPVNPRELMRYIDEFEELHLARLRAETVAEEAELAAESESGRARRVAAPIHSHPGTDIAAHPKSPSLWPSLPAILRR